MTKLPKFYIIALLSLSSTVSIAFEYELGSYDLGSKFYALKEYDKAIEEWQYSADPRAYLAFAKMYENGIYYLEDYEKAYSYYRCALTSIYNPVHKIFVGLKSPVATQKKVKAFETAFKEANSDLDLESLVSCDFHQYILELSIEQCDLKTVQLLLDNTDADINRETGSLSPIEIAGQQIYDSMESSKIGHRKRCDKVMTELILRKPKRAIKPSNNILLDLIATEKWKLASMYVETGQELNFVDRGSGETALCRVKDHLKSAQKDRKRKDITKILSLVSLIEDKGGKCHTASLILE